MAALIVKDGAVCYPDFIKIISHRFKACEAKWDGTGLRVAARMIMGDNMMECFCCFSACFIGLLAGRVFMRCIAAVKRFGENLAAAGGNADRMFILRR